MRQYSVSKHCSKYCVSFCRKPQCRVIFKVFEAEEIKVYLALALTMCLTSGER